MTKALLIVLLLGTFPVLHISAQERAVDASGKKLSVAQCLEGASTQEEQGNYRQASWFLNQAAISRWEEKNYPDAIDFFQRSITLNEKVNNEHGIVGIYSNLAMIYADQQDYEKSVTYFEKTLEGRKKQNSGKVSIISALINTSVALNNLERYNRSAEYLEEALALAREMNDAQQMRSCYGMLSETYEKAGNTEQSIRYFNLYRTFHEMVQRDIEQEYKEKEATARIRAQLAEAEQKAQQIELTYKQKEIEKKNSELAKAQKVLSQFDSTTKQLYESMDRIQLMKTLYNVTKAKKEEQAELHELQLERQRIIQYYLLLGVIAIIIVTLILYRGYREKKRSNHELSEKNHEIIAQREKIEEQNHVLEGALTEVVAKSNRITQSINYAQRIQTAMMPSEEEFTALAPEHFLLFEPRDVVSGDFYWAKEKDGQSVITIADCTGHGVPGAMLSMLGMSKLEQIIDKSPTLDPGLILAELNEAIRSSLAYGSKRTNDGMDISMVVIDRNKNTLAFAGAKNPLAYIDQSGTLQLINGDRTAIGGQKTKRGSDGSFNTHQIPLNHIKAFYLYSDGYQDQFGGPAGRKFMSKNFKALLQEISVLSLEEQKQQLHNNLMNWKGTQDQIDDISVFGAVINPDNSPQ